MDADQFEILVAAILVAGRTAGARRDSTGMRPANAVVGDIATTIRELRLREFTRGTTDVPEAD
jgi:hypothetical protein